MVEFLGGSPSIFSQLPVGQSRSLEESMPSSCDTGGSRVHALPFFGVAELRGPRLSRPFT